MSDWIVTYELKTDDKPDQPTGILAPDGRPIVKVPNPVGFNAPQSPKYGVRP